MAGLWREFNAPAAGAGGLNLAVRVERWPIRGGFTISRGSKTEAVVVVASVSDGRHTGRGECVPYARYGESIEGVAAALEACARPIANGLSRAELAALLPAGAARNALDCALWDLEAKRSGRSAAALAGIGPLHPVPTAFTISLAAPEAMAAGGERIELAPPAGNDDLLQHIERAVPVCADESVHDRASLETIAGRYDAVNIKLDKTGGLTEALLVAADARALGFKIMVGSMVATSLAMAPALLLAQHADFVGLAGPLLLTRDRVPGLPYADGMVSPPRPA